MYIYAYSTLSALKTVKTQVLWHFGETDICCVVSITAIPNPFRFSILSTMAGFSFVNEQSQLNYGNNFSRFCFPKPGFEYICVHESK